MKEEVKAMGTWGTKPWDSDAAADWFGNLMDQTNLAEYVEETLQREMEEGFLSDADEIRAAAAVLVLLGHTYVWPVEDLDRHLELAASRLEEILRRGFYGDDENFIRPIEEEIKILRARIGGGAKADIIDKVKWWHF
jgi:hypothetical protein